MLDVAEAKRIGIKACIDKIGMDFYENYKENACFSCGMIEDIMFCSVGIDDKPFLTESDPKRLVLSAYGFKYFVSCNVDMESGSVDILECEIPLITGK